MARGERGSVTAEFACVMPAVIMVLLLALGSFQVVSQQIRVSDAASTAARMLGRFGPAGLAGLIASARVCALADGL